MIVHAVRAVIFLALLAPSLVAVAQSRPAFCEQIPDALLGGLKAPYARYIAPDGSVYCEGLLRNPISLAPPTVVSLKQDQNIQPRFELGKTAVITWCDQSADSVHVRLRSLKPPLFALDAMHASNFEWRSDLIAKWQPDWRNVGAAVVRITVIGGHRYEVMLPVRTNLRGYSSSYSFIVQSQRPIHLTTALIEPIQSTTLPLAVDVSFSQGPTKNTWVAVIPFANLSDGIYRVTFEESIDQAGDATEPIYLLHKACR